MKRKNRVVNPGPAKGKRYKRILHEIQGAGVCPFCPETFRWHTKPILGRLGDWLITENFNPYKNARCHFIIVKKTHQEHFGELSPADWKDLSALVRWAIKKFKIQGGGFMLRFGDTAHTGATVRHLHAHLIAPKMKDGRAKPVNFPIG